MDPRSSAQNCPARSCPPVRAYARDFGGPNTIRQRFAIGPASRVAAPHDRTDPEGHDQTMNDTHTRQFDLIVIGAGSGGIAAAIRAARHGARVAVLEPSALGGTCVNVGCVPKKAMWLAGELAEAQALAAELGFANQPAALDWSAYVERREHYIRNIHASYRQRFDSLAITLIPERARLLGDGRVGTDTQTLRADNILIATGGRAERLAIPGGALGIDSNGFFDLRAAPRKVAIIGSGYIAVELGGVLRALGSEVSLFVRTDRVLRTFDADISDALAAAMTRRGIKIELRHQLDRVSEDAGGYRIHCRSGLEDAGFDALLWAVGRVPNTTGLGLEAAGVRLDARGFIAVDEWQATSAAHVFAVGDVTPAPALAPVAGARARAVMVRVVGGWRGRLAAHFSLVGFLGLLVCLGSIVAISRGWH